MDRTPFTSSTLFTCFEEFGALFDTLALISAIHHKTSQLDIEIRDLTEYRNSVAYQPLSLQFPYHTKT